MEPILEIRQLEDFEFFVQWSFFTADLHVTRAWSLCSETSISRLSHLAQDLHGSIVNSLVELSRVAPPLSVDSVLAAKEMPPIDATTMIFPLGLLDPPSGFATNPIGTYRFMLFKLVLGLPFDFQDEGFESTPIPNRFSSVVQRKTDKSTNSCSNACRYNVRINHSRQALPIAIIEIQFKPLRIEVSLTVCEICQARDATVYCPSDQVHLCSSCDVTQHGRDKLLAAHKCVPVSESPSMFGSCQFHPAENSTAVCLTCFVQLCPQCLLIGPHCSSDTADHEIVSNVDAYRVALVGITKCNEDDRVEKKDGLWNKRLERAMEQSAEILEQAESLKSRIDSVAQRLFGHFTSLRGQRLRLCDGYERQLLGIVRQTDWVDQVLVHLRKALSPTDFLYFKHRHDLLADWFFADAIPVDLLKFPPPSLFQKIYLEGSLGVGPSKPPFPIVLEPRPVFEASQREGYLPRLFFSPSLTETTQAKKESLPSWVSFISDSVGTGPFGVVKPLLPVTRGVDEKIVPQQVFSTKLSTDAEPISSFGSQKHLHSYYTPLLETEDFVAHSSSLAELYREKENNARPIETASSRGLEVLETKLAKRDDVLRHTDIPRSIEEFWRLLKEFRWEGLIILLKICPSSLLTELTGWICNVSVLMNDLESLMQIVFEVENLMTSHKSPKALTRFPSLVVPLTQHILGSEEVLSPRDRNFIDGLLDSLMSSYTDQTSPGQAINLLINNLTKCSAKDIPPSILTILYMISQFASNLENIAYPAGVLEEIENERRTGLKDRPQWVAISMFVDALIRFCLAESLARRTLRKSLSVSTVPSQAQSSESTKVLVMSNALKVLGHVVWRLPPSRPYTIKDVDAPGADDPDAEVLFGAEKLRQWVSTSLINYCPRSGIRTNKISMYRIGLSGMSKICEYIVAVDGAIWRGDYQDAGSAISLEGYSAQEIIEKTRNYDRFVLLAMTYRQNQLQHSNTPIHFAVPDRSSRRT